MAASWFGRHVLNLEDRASSTPHVEARAVVELPWNYGGSLGSTPAVTQEQALRLEPVFAAWRLLANGIASLPIHTYRRTGDDRRRIPTAKLFEDPAPPGTLYDWLFRAVISMCSTGNAVGLIYERDAMEYPTGIEWLDPQRVRPQGTVSRPDWYIDGSPVPREDIFHIPWFPMPGQIWGLSPLTAFALTVTGGLAARSYTADWFQKGGVPPGHFQNVEKKVDAEAAGEIKRRLVRAIEERNPIVYGADWKYEPIAVASHEAAFVDSLRMDATQIAAVYGINPEDIGGQTANSLTYSTVELSQIKMNTTTLRPWVTKFEQAFYRLTPRPQYVKFAMDANVRSDLKTRYEAYAIGLRDGWLTVNEVRSLEDRDPLPENTQAEPMSVKINAAGSLIRAGFDPDDVLRVLGVPPMRHLGLPPITVQPEPTADEGNQPAQLRPVASAGDG